MSLAIIAYSDDQNYFATALWKQWEVLVHDDP